MNSLQIDYLNAISNAKKSEAEAALANARIAETVGRTDYLNTQASGQRLNNRQLEATLSNLDRQVLNAKYKLDMDNAMLYNTVDWWVNGGKKLSDWSNRRWNPYWNTSGNMGREFRETIQGIGSILSLPGQAISGFWKPVNPGGFIRSIKTKGAPLNINNAQQGFINS